MVATAAAAVFWRTAYPTITWWDSSNYSLAAVTLGVTSSPGSLLLTLLGWTATRIPTPLSEAQTLNLVAGVLGGVTVALVMVVALRILRLFADAATPDERSAMPGVALGALAFAFGVTLWEHAIKFTPYVLTVVFTGLILLVLVRWWEVADRPESWRWIAVLTFLFGLDFSVHRTNALLIPGAIAWILVRHPGTLLQSRAWLGAVGGMAIGLSLQLVVMPISATTTSPLNMFQPDTWSRFWDYVSLAQTGGNFQLGLWPRKSAFWSNQVGDLTRVFVANFAHTTSSVGIAGLLPGLAGIAGIGVLWRRGPRLAAAFCLLLVLQAAATVLYFNIPANFFRSLDRHYLPVLTTFAVAVAIGLGTVTQRLAALCRRKPILAAEAATVVLFVPVVQLMANWHTNDASRRFFTRDFAVNALEALPPRAFYFTVGDNDTFPVMYLQAVENVRPDVRIVNLSLANTDWYIDQIRTRDPSFPVKGTPDERRAANASTWKDSALVLRLTRSDGTRRLVPTAAADSFLLRPVPAMTNALLPADDVFLDIVREAAFSTPVTIASTAGSSGLAWLAPLARVDGLHWRLVPSRSPRPDPTILRANLLDRNEYRGYADSSIVLEPVTRTMGFLYRDAFRTLLQAERDAGNVATCRALAARVDTILPPSRLTTPQAVPPRLDLVCGS